MRLYRGPALSRGCTAVFLFELRCRVWSSSGEIRDGPSQLCDVILKAILLIN